MGGLLPLAVSVRMDVASLHTGIPKSRIESISYLYDVPVGTGAADARFATRPYGPSSGDS